MSNKKSKISDLNLEIANFIKEKDRSSAAYSSADIAFISQYTGSGGVKGEKDVGILNEFYTPDWLATKMWELAKFYGYNNGYVLEPSIATGVLIQDAPDKSKCVGFETNPISTRICQIKYPKATIYNQYFETAFLEPEIFRKNLPKSKTTWLSQFPFSLVIGNPPYGIHKNLYSSYFKNYKQIECFFILKALELLEKEGLLIYLISANFMSNGDKYNEAKEQIGKMADLVDAFRLPKVFERSDVPTDIIILRKK